MKRTGIIDMDGVIHCCIYGVKLLDNWGNPIKEDNKFVYREKTEQEVYTAIDQVMEDLLEKSGLTHYIAFVKGKDTIKDRLAVNCDYKGNRTKEVPQHYKIGRQYTIDRWNAIEVNGKEVDDACRISNIQIPNSFIIAVDKDLLSLEGTHYDWKKACWCSNHKGEAELRFWASMITGDSADNLPGLKGKGPKYAEKLLTQIEMLEFSLPSKVLSAYIEHYGEEEVAIEEFYKHYKCLHILKKCNTFEIPESIEYKQVEDEIDF